MTGHRDFSRTAVESVLRDIRNGVTYPDRWPEDLEEDEEGENEDEGYTRWWEVERETPAGKRNVK